MTWRDAGLGLRRGEVRLAETDTAWPEAFEYLAAELQAALGDAGTAIEHVSSTAVPGLPAKPILDIAAGLQTAMPLDELVQRFRELRFEFRGDKGDEGGLLFVLNDQPNHRVAHVHVVAHGCPQWRRYLAVRDRLRSDPAARQRYATLKRRLASQLVGDRAAYTAGKATFLESLTGEQ